MPLQQITAPGLEPVTLADMRNYLRLDSDITQDDTLVSLLIATARRYAESWCTRSFITQQWRLVLDSFPGPAQTGVPWGRPYGIPAHAILLERAPVQSVDSITYTAMDGTETVMPATDWVVDLSGPLARVTPRFGKIWPVPLPQIGAVKVAYTAGYGATPDTVPEGIRQWIMLRVATIYENREEVAVLQRGSLAPLPYVDGLLDPYRVVTY